jgi:hypothetical protein
MRIARLHTRLFIVVAAMGSNPVWADDVAMPAAAEPAATVPVSTPSRGITMTKVESEYGSPSERHSAIGSPPITRWDYPGFSVFFERDHVIHSVVSR